MDWQSATASLLRRHALIVMVASSLCACGDDDGSIGSGIEHDGGPDGGDAAVPNDDDDSGPPVRCDHDRECDDGKVCNGRERCVDHLCRDGEPKACSGLHPCDEAIGDCDCRNPSWDGDGFPARECPIPGKQEDCDDSKASVNPGLPELCDPGVGLNEDCRSETFHNPTRGELGHGDNDGDTFISTACFNLDARLVKLPGGDDCDDDNPAINPDAKEECDTIDNDCDGDVDEDEDPDSVTGTLRVELFPDVDGDGFPARGEPIWACEGHDQPAGYARPTESDDCNDLDAKINGSALELCNGVDDDCDDKVDADDGDLIGEPTEEGTTFACEGGDWVIKGCPPDLRWCDMTTIAQGCETDATTLQNCRGCGRECSFACGEVECERAVQITAGYEHSCIVTNEGNAACWGFGFLGRLGTGRFASTATPSQVLRVSGAHLIAAGAQNTCATVGPDRQLYCWGNNEYGLLATDDLGSSGASALPLPASGGGLEPVLSDVVSVAIATSHVCAVKGTGELFCWGLESNGRLGNRAASDAIRSDPSQARRAMGVPVTDAAAVTVGENHGCMITQANQVECWGSNGSGQLGDPEDLEDYSTIPVPVPGLSNIAQVSAGEWHTCAVTTAGQVLCWGSNDQYQLGREDGDDAAALAVDGLGAITAVAAGSTFTCALDQQHEVWCWGSNASGERGAAAAEDSATPEPVDVGAPVLAIAAGALHVCAITVDQDVRCWGENVAGQLGIGDVSFEPVLIPQRVVPLQRVTQ